MAEGSAEATRQRQVGAPVEQHFKSHVLELSPATRAAFDAYCVAANAAVGMTDAAGDDGYLSMILGEKRMFQHWVESSINAVEALIRERCAEEIANVHQHEQNVRLRQLERAGNTPTTQPCSSSN